MIWHILDRQFCSFKTQFEKKKFCKNEYNLTGTCSKFSCPLANGRYATVLEENGILYLHIKTIERAHSPANLWEKIQLPSEIGGAIRIINENLAFWPKNLVNKVKERLIRLHQYLIRYRKWYYRAKPRLVVVHKKFERREQRRELKALIAAKLDFAIKNELLERLKQGTYEPFINLNNKAYTELLREEKRREKLALRGRKKTRLTETETEKEDQTKKDTSATATADTTDGVDLDADNIDFVEAEDDEVDLNDMDDMEDYIVGEEDEDEDEEELDAEEEHELEQEDDGQDALRADILKHFPINLGAEPDDDEELARLKKRLILKRKRKLEEKLAEEKKRSKDAQKKKKRYGAHVEIEYEPSTATSTQTSTSSW